MSEVCRHHLLLTIHCKECEFEDRYPERNCNPHAKGGEELSLQNFILEKDKCIAKLEEEVKDLDIANDDLDNDTTELALMIRDLKVKVAELENIGNNLVFIVSDKTKRIADLESALETAHSDMNKWGIRAQGARALNVDLGKISYALNNGDKS